MTDELLSKIKLLPTNPGVYVMQDKDGNVIYVGKAKNLKNRVTSYFRNGFKTEKVAQMVLNIVDFYYILTPSEKDALTLENNLIKKYKPKYNILLKDDKAYPYIRVNLKEKYPRFTVTRKLKKDGAKYFGPYMLGANVNDILEVLKEAYLIRPCNLVLDVNKKRKECLNYHISRCLAPCAQKCTEKEYDENVKRAIDFLNGNTEEALNLLTEKMNAVVENEEYERAIVLRDKINMLSKLKDKQITQISRFITADVISTKSDGIFSSITIMFVRSGRVSGIKNFANQTLSEKDSERVSEFISRYYLDGKQIPDEIIVPCEIENKDVLQDYLSELKGKKTEIILPKKAVRYKLLEMATENAEDYLSRQINKVKHKDDMTIIACERLQKILNLKRYPRRIECYDISHISGVDKVGSMTVFIDGEPSKNDYRRFKIKTVEWNNDFECLKEVLTRRLLRLDEEGDKWSKPDIILIDGGKGQLSAVSEAIERLAPDIEYISIAEKNEEIYTLYSKEPIVLDKSDYCLKVLQRIRDEAHRFAITFNRQLRGKRTLKSILLEIEGIGAKKRNALLDAFKDILSIKNASLEDIMKVDGIGLKQAQKIKDYFAEKGND